MGAITSTINTNVIALKTLERPLHLAGSTKHNKHLVRYLFEQEGGSILSHRTLFTQETIGFLIIDFCTEKTLQENRQCSIAARAKIGQRTPSEGTFASLPKTTAKKHYDKC
jgi:hypothetical protein